MIKQKIEVVKDEDFYYYNNFSKAELIQKLKNVNKALRDKITENNSLRSSAKIPEYTCDVCGCHPNVIYTTPSGRFCQHHFEIFNP